MEVVEIKGQPRVDTGKKGTKAVRNAGDIPCVMYGGSNPVHFSTAVNDVKSIVYTPEFKLANITIDGNTHKCILKTLQFHPISDQIMHIDFLELVEGQKVTVEVPIQFTGTSPGVKVGGKLLQKVRKVKIKTTPQYIVDKIEMDISSLELGQSVRIRDIAEMEGMEIMNSPGIPVATIEIPRALRSAAAAAEKGAGA